MTARLAPPAFRRLPGGVASVLALACALAATGCAGPKDAYPAVAEAQQRQAAEEGASARAGSQIDTQATYLKLVEQMQQEGLWFASLAHIDALEQRWGASPESTRARAEALRHAGQAAQSETAYRRLLGTPLAAAGYRGLGLLAGARGDYAEAVRMLRQARDRNPTDALLLNDLGYASLRAGQVAEARLPLMQALQLRPDNPQAQANLAMYLEATQQHAQAAALMDANKMPPATRAAIRDAARQLARPAAPPVVAATPVAGAPVLDDSAIPLLLKPSQTTLRPRAGSNPRGAP
ncbi:Flp pilus assembly protein TadD [Variovorax sp. TBS-050B]|uniref:tetratricopeptide repeat protein n=1 Tax=Variovorax sp. TBS-050B TaxID=2940551 RepID=UPI00247460A2|nr:tetratricopeptide repeat protein [Variovorax sp. TBS-050B]MDH6591322.1 Flp pilus assembly protein TadD [Variovorax sp. TBS-050B]